MYPHLLFLLLPTLAGSYSVVVTGANGYLGTEIVHQLIAAGHRVTAVTRKIERASHLQILSTEGTCCNVVECNIAVERDSFESILRDCEAEVIINTAAVFRKSCKSYETELVKPTIAIVENVLWACKSNKKVRRIVHTSSMASVRDPRQEPSNGKYYTSEDWNTMSSRDGPWPEPYQFAKTESERVLMNLGGQINELDIIALCPSMIYGPPRDTKAAEAAVSVRDLLQCLRGSSAFKSRLICDVRDVAAAHVAALNCCLHPEPGSNGNKSTHKGIQRRYILGPERRVAARTLLNAVIADKEISSTFGPELTRDGYADRAFQPAIPIGEREVDSSPAEADLACKSLRPPLATVLDTARAFVDLSQVGALGDKCMQRDGNIDISDQVEVRSAGTEKGLGVFALKPIAAGTPLGYYEGEYRTPSEHCALEQDGNALDYCFRLTGTKVSATGEVLGDDEGFIDAFKSKHWTRFMNHAEESIATVTYDVQLRERKSLPPSLAACLKPDPRSSSDKRVPVVLFLAAKNISEEDELVFDYGISFWDGRAEAVADGTDSRIFSPLSLAASAADPASQALGTPMSIAAVYEILRAPFWSGISKDDKRAALGRALDYFGVDTNAIPIGRTWWQFWRVLSPPVALSLEELSISQLARALVDKIREIEISDEEDDYWDCEDAHFHGKDRSEFLGDEIKK